MAQQFVNSKLAPDKVVIFGKSSCPFCHRALDLLEELNLKSGHLEYIDLSKRSDMADIQDYLLEITGARTVPRIFIGYTCIGGFTDLDALKRSGELESLLKKIGAL
ncbi:glutaredoxin-1 [Sceloporus undulatus]|uniref:glutaredoxin-1 n=1 Tax=Sceloporus undulatus TaxID=8520 RepID=UPI001C4C2745|nr:glutaredoxin-1 [Sceloporus undulatus]